ncbi:MAG: hypothetical protein LBI18_06915 [Planctomycetaceae bacterium]|jgi:flagellar biogenesis protein FliO|nr:hypothetical protein [Planctomycetaceae bacterium]
MPDFRILIIIIVTFVLTGVCERANLVAEEPNRPFLDRPSASFAASNFSKPSVTSSPSRSNSYVSSAPVPPQSPKSPEQLRYLRDSLSATPQHLPQPAHQSSSPKISQPIPQSTQTAHAGNQELPPIRQVAAVEPTQQPVLPAKEPKETIEYAKISTATNTGTKTNIETNSEIDAEIVETQPQQSTGNPSDQLLDKPIASGKTGNEKRLLHRPKIANMVTPLIPIFGSLLIVIGAFFILVLFLRRVSPKGNRLLPKEAFEDLGRAVLTQKIQLHLLRLGNRLLLVSITPDGVSPITEIVDPDEVVPLLGLCRQLDTYSSTEFFRKTLSSFSTGGTEGGYFGTDAVKANTNPNNKKNTPRTVRSKQSTRVDLYSEPDESLAEILAKGGQHG